MDSDHNKLYPILEYDPAPKAILEPRGPELSEPVPDRAVLCFFRSGDGKGRLRDEGRLVEIGEIRSEMGPSPVYRLEQGGQRMLVVHPGVGAPLAAGFTDELIAIGVKKFIACGGCGVLDKEIAVGYPVILTGAVRDEGTSYHYLPPARAATPSPVAVAALEQTCQEAQ